MRGQHVMRKERRRFRPVGMTWVLLAAGLALWVAGGLTPAAAQTANERTGASAYDPRALQLLDRMASAYSHLSDLEQTSEFYSDLLPLAPAPVKEGSASKPGSAEQKPQRTLRLFFQNPNSLRLESEEPDPKSNRPLVSEWVCDGKEFWSYSADSRLYTR